MNACCLANLIFGFQKDVFVFRTFTTTTHDSTSLLHIYILETFKWYSSWQRSENDTTAIGKYASSR